MVKKLIFGVVGSPPTTQATREERLRWVRKFYRLNLVAIAVVVVFAVVDGGTLPWIVAAAGVIWWASGWTAITRSIHREESRDT